MVFRKDYPSLDVSRARVVLVEMQDHLLHPFTASSRRHALETLRVARRRGAARRPGRVRRPPTRVTFADGEVLPCQTLVWAAGVQANPLAAAARPPAGPRRPGRRRARPARARSSRRRGRSATSPPPRDRRGEVLPQLAPVAMQSRPPRRPPDPPAARGLGPPTPFRYLDKGTMATIGRRAAVAELPGRHPPAGRAGLAGVARPPPRHPRRHSATARRCSSTGPGTTSPGTAAPASSSVPRPLTAHVATGCGVHRTWHVPG